MEFVINLDDRGGDPLHQQVYRELRRSILIGRLAAGQRIPSTRALAKSLGVSRATVTQGYEQLINEGYLQTVVGSGTSVSTQLPDDLLQAPVVKRARNARPNGDVSFRFSRIRSELIDVIVTSADKQRLVFQHKRCRWFGRQSSFPSDLSRCCVE